MQKCSRCEQETDQIRPGRGQCRPCETELKKQRREAKRGWAPDHDMTHKTPEGFHVRGVSTLYGPDGDVKAQWVKTQLDKGDRLAMLAEAVAELAEPFKGLADPVTSPEVCMSDLMAIYPLGDPHIGMFSWAKETGEDFDLEIGERNLMRAIDHLVMVAPPAALALLVNLGDFFHSDNSDNRTARSGHALDVDSRWAKILAVGIRVMRYMIDKLLTKHEKVRVICEIGNHDDHSAIMLGLCLANYYEREPRVEIDTSPAKFHWVRFGENLIGVTHGDGIKKADLPGVMACDRKEDWGQTTHRYWYTGHVHHDSVREYPGCLVESFRTLAPRDAWHHASGYRSGQDMKCDILHRKHGRVNRHIVGIQQIWGDDDI